MGSRRWLAWRICLTRFLRGLGMTSLDLDSLSKYTSTSSSPSTTTVMLRLFLWYGRSSGVQSLTSSGKPSNTAFFKAEYSLSPLPTLAISAMVMAMSSSLHLLSTTSSTSEMWQALIAAPASLSVQNSLSSYSLNSSSSRFSYTHDMQSGVSFWSPGRYWILKLYLRVRSLKRYSLGLAMSAMSLLFIMGTRGSWSVVTRRLGHPRLNILALSRDRTTPRASPSIGAYLDSAPEHLLLPANTILNPSLQHLGAIVRAQSQYF